MCLFKKGFSYLGTAPSFSRQPLPAMKRHTTASSTRLLLSLTALLLIAVAKPPTACPQALTPGHLALVGLNADNPDEFAFVALTAIASGTEIKFTDNGWLAAGAFRGGEQTLIYTAPTALAAGEVVTINTSNVSAFSVSGDQLLAYQGDESNPSFVYALNVEGNGLWQADATNSNTSALPAGLTNGSTAVAVNERDNVRYNGPTTGTRTELLAAIGDRANWTGSNSARQSFPGSFTVTDTGGNAFPQFTSGLTDQEIPSEAAFSFTYEATDADGDALTFSLVDPPAGAAIDATTGVFTWTPTMDQAGQVHTITTRVSDGMATTQTAAGLTVTAPPNQRPAFTATLTDMLVDSGTTITFTYGGSDADGDVLSFALVSPAGATIDPATGAFSWTPTGAGVFTVAVSVTDGAATTTARSTVGVRGTLFPGQSGSALRGSLRNSFTPAMTLGYDVARDTMYGVVDLAPDGLVRGVYTDFAVELTAGDPSTVMFQGGINAEHTWPQSKGAGQEPARSDLHSLFPAKSNVNSSRSNKPFAVIPDAETQRWFLLDQSQTTIPAMNIDAFSESAPGVFEPRELHTGNAARAALYFFTIYESVAERTFLADQMQLDYLIAWNTLDPADLGEVVRSGKIAQYQDNINPFVVDPSLALRAFCDIIR